MLVEIDPFQKDLYSFEHQLPAATRVFPHSGVSPSFFVSDAAKMIRTSNLDAELSIKSIRKTIRIEKNRFFVEPKIPKNHV